MGQGVAMQYVDPQGFSRQLNGQFIGGKYAAVTLNSAAGIAPQNILQVPAGLYGFIWGVQFTIDPTCTLAAGGMNGIGVTTVNGGETIAMLRAYIPATFTAPTVPTVNRQVSAPGAFFGCSVAGDTIQCANSVALTAGSIRVSFNYGFSNVPVGN